MLDVRCRGEGIALCVAGGGVINVCLIVIGSRSMEF